ncbi:hypothetical protein CRE_17827 [Caenorhabditis remanei]|uniref:Uncharacterized protein n=1 Tax=Caenorhabditis remanei TaxID=31234 RepID=E3MDJ7_CAERE|nr:hypothetical protein CRE_17827 [Caenorhabditis remanei]
MNHQQIIDILEYRQAIMARREEARYLIPFLPGYVQDTQESYIRRAKRDHNEEIACPICREAVLRKHFLKEHLDKCAEEKRATEMQKDYAQNWFQSSDYFINHEASLLREKLEIAFMESLVDGKLTRVACALCDTLEQHVGGGCLDDYQKHAFKETTNQKKGVMMLKYRQVLQWDVEIGLEEISKKYEVEVDDLIEEPTGDWVRTNVNLNSFLNIFLQFVDQQNERRLGDILLASYDQKIIEQRRFMQYKMDNFRAWLDHKWQHAENVFNHHMIKMGEYLQTVRGKPNIVEILESRKRGMLDDEMEKEYEMWAKEEAEKAANAANNS